MKNKRHCWIIVLVALLLLLLQSCSRPAMNIDNLVSCENGTNPTPIDSEFDFPGDLLFVKRDGSEILAFNGKTHQFTSIFRLPENGTADVSPLSRDGKTLVVSYQNPSDMKNLSVIVLSPQGIIESSKILIPPLGHNRERIIQWASIGWVNSDLFQGVLFEKGMVGDELSQNQFFNPYKLEWGSLNVMIQDLDVDPVGGFLFSPDLTRVLYVNSEYHLALYDFSQKKNIWEYHDYDGISPNEQSPILEDAIWSPDGNMLALPLTNEDRVPIALILDKDGQIINSIYFGNYQHGFSWSKDGQFLAFYEDRCTTIDSIIRCEARPVIRVISTKDGLLRDLCSLTEGILPTQSIRNFRIIWSPDQEFLVYSSANHETGTGGFFLQKLNDPEVRIIDVKDDSLILLGWSQEHWEKAQP